MGKGRLDLSISDIVDRIIVTLPSKFSRDENSEVYKFFKAVGKLFELSLNQIDDLFERTSIACSGAYLDAYINQLSNIGRKQNETDEDYRNRYYKYVFTYNSTKQGMSVIVYDVLGYYPVALVDMQRSMFYDSKFYWNDLGGNSVWGKESGEPYIGYIVLAATPTSGEIETLCKLINENKAAGVQTFLRLPQYNWISSNDYAFIAEQVSGQTNLVYKRGQPFGFNYGEDVSPYRPYWEDPQKKRVWADPDRDNDDVIVFLSEAPTEAVLNELIDQLEANRQAGDNLKIWIPLE